jgi:hypothetical protein
MNVALSKPPFTDDGQRTRNLKASNIIINTRQTPLSPAKVVSSVLVAPEAIGLDQSK